MTKLKMYANYKLGTAKELASIEDLKGTVLYNNSTGTNGNVTLSETSDNFEYIKVYYMANVAGSNVRYSREIYNPNGKTIGLDYVLTYSTSQIRTGNVTYNISGTIMTKLTGGFFVVYAGAINEFNTTDAQISILRVVGYK